MERGKKGNLKAILKGCGMDHILMPKSSFVKEHKKLLKVLKEGKPKALKKEYEEQKKELKEKVGGRKKEPKTEEEEERDLEDSVGNAISKLKEEFKHIDNMNDVKARLSSYDGPSNSVKAIYNHLRPYAVRINKRDWKRKAIEIVDALQSNTSVDLDDLKSNDQLDEDYDDFKDKTIEDYKNSLILRIYRMRNRIEDLVSITPQSERSEESKVSEGEGEGGSKASGFIKRMLGEIKLKHDGEYKYPTKPLSKESTMNAPVAFDYFKMPKESREMSKFIMTNLFRIRPYKAGEREELNETELAMLREAEKERQRRSRAARKRKEESS